MLPRAPPSSQDGLSSLRTMSKRCTACDLYKNATQTVFGAGAAHAAIVLVGEQPGDEEDRAGKPFIGPAGKLLAAALAQAGIAKRETYITNAVKHFKWIPRGKRRLHQKPNVGEIRACHRWIEAELASIQPKVIVCLGATAGRSILGREVKIGRERGMAIAGPHGAMVLITAHPSSILRMRTSEERSAALAALIHDLRCAQKFVRRESHSGGNNLQC